MSHEPCVSFSVLVLDLSPKLTIGSTAAYLRKRQPNRFLRQFMTCNTGPDNA